MLAAAGLWLTPAPVRAHPAPFSYLDLTLTDGGVRGTLTIHDLDAAYELRLGEADALLDLRYCCAIARVKILRMESSLFMQMVCRSGLPPALFWLDAHYPGADVGLAGYADEADASLRLPLREELEQIARHRAGRDVILIDDLRIYETGDWDDGPLPPDAPGNPTPGGADWMRALFAGTHRAVTVNRDQGYLMLLPLDA